MTFIVSDWLILARTHFTSFGTSFHLSAKVKSRSIHLQQTLFFQSASSSQSILLVTTAYCLWGLTNIGLLYDQAPLAWPSELARCLVTLVMFSTLAPIYISSNIVYNIFTASTFICVAMLINTKTKEKIFWLNLPDLHLIFTWPSFDVDLDLSLTKGLRMRHVNPLICSHWHTDKSIKYFQWKYLLQWEVPTPYSVPASTRAQINISRSSLHSHHPQTSGPGP